MNSKQIAIHPRPTVEEINKCAQEIISIPPSPTRDVRLSQVWYLAFPEDARNKIWTSPEVRNYFLETQRKYPGWVEEDFSILHIAVTGETPVY